MGEHVNKKDLAEAWGERTKAESKAAARRGLEEFIDLVRETVAGGDEVRIGGLGVIERVYRKGRTARNPNTNEPIEVPGHWAVRFRPAKEFIDAVNN